MDQTLNEKLAALRAELELDEAATPNAYRIGTVRTWKSGRFKKTATGWVPVSAVLKKVANAPKGATGVQVVKSGGKPPFGKVTSDVKTFINTPGVVTYMPKGESSPYGGFRRLAGLFDDRVLEADESPAVSKYAENPAAYNAEVARLMQQLKKDKSLGVTGVRMGYKGTGGQAHKRQIWVKVPSHERGGPDVWLEGGYVRVGGIIDIPKNIPSVKKYGEETPQQVYRFIADTLKALKTSIDAKYANSPAVKAEELELAEVQMEFLAVCEEGGLNCPEDLSLEGMEEFILRLDEASMVGKIKKGFKMVFGKIQKLGKTAALAATLGAAGAAGGHLARKHDVGGVPSRAVRTAVQKKASEHPGAAGAVSGAALAAAMLARRKKKQRGESIRETMLALRAELEEGESVANMGDDDVVKTARALASKGRKGKLSPKETKDFKMAMQRIKDEGLLGDDDQKDIWQWYGKGGQ